MTTTPAITSATTPATTMDLGATRTNRRSRRASVRRLLLTLTAALLAGTCVAGPARAEGPANTVTVTVVKTGSKTITVKPVLGSEGHFGLWNLKLNASSRTKIKTLDGTNVLKSLKKGAIAEVVFENALKTTTIFIPLYTKVGNSTIVTMIPVTETRVEGAIVAIKETSGRCTSKTIKLGGRGEKVGVGICRTGSSYEIVAKTNDADHKEDVLAALTAATMIVIDRPSGQQLKTTGFETFGEYAHASIPGAPGAAATVKVIIRADGPHDGKPEKDFVVLSNTKL